MLSVLGEGLSKTFIYERYLAESLLAAFFVFIPLSKLSLVIGISIPCTLDEF